MKITLAQLNYHIGNFDGNLSQMKEAIDKATEDQSDLICFSELSTCGYPPRDFLEFRDFIHQSMNVIQSLCEHSFDIAIVVGAPTVNPEIEGKDLYNSAFFIYGGKVQHIAHKALLPNYDIFDEYRYFEPNKKFKTVEFKGKKIAITICEDIWNLGNNNPMYTIVPMDEMMKENPDFILNLSASPFSATHAKERIEVIRANVQKYKIPMFYCNSFGSQTDVIFDGGSIVMSPDGLTYDEMPFFKKCQRNYDLHEVCEGGKSNELPKEEVSLIYQALVLGIKDYFQN
jgi:NAD+ synthase (glutamine-hydrolysing)